VSAKTFAVLPHWQSTVVRGHRTRYLEGGQGPIVVFLHGWGLTHKTYRRALNQLVLKGMRVLAPA